MRIINVKTNYRPVNVAITAGLILFSLGPSQLTAPLTLTTGLVALALFTSLRKYHQHQSEKLIMKPFKRTIHEDKCKIYKLKQEYWTRINFTLALLLIPCVGPLIITGCKC